MNSYSFSLLCPMWFDSWLWRCTRLNL